MRATKMALYKADHDQLRPSIATRTYTCRARDATLDAFELFPSKRVISTKPADVSDLMITWLLCYVVALEPLIISEPDCGVDTARGRVLQESDTILPVVYTSSITQNLPPSALFSLSIVPLLPASDVLFLPKRIATHWRLLRCRNCGLENSISRAVCGAFTVGRETHEYSRLHTQRSPHDRRLVSQQRALRTSSIAVERHGIPLALDCPVDATKWASRHRTSRRDSARAESPSGVLKARGAHRVGDRLRS
ncbi:hypothetical protein EVAR_52627_1 [Eumeta japonica]|uniref:Uncharacterized protein n=1 Tax=Eumeta variegata TaxID=151549 RepID=A0A4C1XXZ2_EUMVA|nr:hypothetical protein EVAR_52627_1 [Eumeta japonica]